MEIKVDCAVKSMEKGDDNDFVRGIETTRGTLSWPSNKTKIILCAGTVPNATMLLNSFESCRDTVGQRLTGHYDTHVSARCPVKNVKGWKKKETLKIAAAYLAGKDPKTGLQYHVSITAIHSPNPKDDAEDAARERPDYAAAATLDQLTGSENYVVFGMELSFAMKTIEANPVMFSLLGFCRVQRIKHQESCCSQQSH